MKKSIFNGILLLSATVLSCTDFDISVEEGQLVQLEDVTMIAKDFVAEQASTKTTVSYTDRGAVFAWTSSDVVGVFPHNNQGTQVKFPISEGGVEGGESTQNAHFTGNGWAVMKASKYAAYYPSWI